MTDVKIVERVVITDLDGTPLSGSADSATSLAIVDDWDESDRAKVNPIVGQAGVAAGAGAVDATVQRVTLASDDPAVASVAAFTRVSAGTLTSVDSAATSAQLLAANANRRGCIIRNTDANSLYIHYGTTATANAAIEIPTGAMWEMPQPIYTGRIDGIWAADGAGAAKILEL